MILISISGMLCGPLVLDHLRGEHDCCDPVSVPVHPGYDIWYDIILSLLARQHTNCLANVTSFVPVCFCKVVNSCLVMMVKFQRQHVSKNQSKKM